MVTLGAGGGARARAGWENGAETIAATKDCGLSRERIREITGDVPANAAVGLVLIERLRAERSREIGMATGGGVLANAFISPGALIAPRAAPAGGS